MGYGRHFPTPVHVGRAGNVTLIRSPFPRSGEAENEGSGRGNVPFQTMGLHGELITEL